MSITLFKMLSCMKSFPNIIVSTPTVPLERSCLVITTLCVKLWLKQIQYSPKGNTRQVGFYLNTLRTSSSMKSVYKIKNLDTPSLMIHINVIITPTMWSLSGWISLITFVTLEKSFINFFFIPIGFPTRLSWLTPLSLDVYMDILYCSVSVHVTGWQTDVDHNHSSRRGHHRWPRLETFKSVDYCSLTCH